MIEPGASGLDGGPVPVSDSGSDPQKLKELKASFEAAQEEAGKYVIPNEFGEAVEKAGGKGLNAFTGSDSTCYFFSLPSNELELWFYLEAERFSRPVFREFYITSRTLTAPTMRFTMR
jgi:predicted Zn-dependent peptidase